MKTLSTPVSSEERHAHNEIAALLSIIPGLGHIYKGHYEAGLLWMFLGMPCTIWIGIILSLATAGIGLLFPILCWVALAWDAYNEKDRRHHHLTAMCGRMTMTRRINLLRRQRSKAIATKATITCAVPLVSCVVISALQA